MAISEQEIKEWSEYITKRHSQRVNEQVIDQSYYDDTFDLKIVEDEKYVMKNGFVASLVNSIAQQAIAYQPKIYVEAKGKTTQDKADRVAQLCNAWVRKLAKQSQNPFRETFKHFIGTRGESWIYVYHNEMLAKYDGDWRDEYSDVSPVRFDIYDPMVVFHDPSEEIDGKPLRLLIKYKRLVSDICSVYPHWNRKDHNPGDEVEFEFYVDRHVLYAKAEDRPVFYDVNGNLSNGDGFRENLYRCVPFVHKYSGYGTLSANMAPELLAFSRTRMIRDKVMEDASMSTDFRYNQHELAWHVKTIFLPEGSQLPDNFLDNYKRDPNTINIVTLPAGGKMEVEDTTAFGQDAHAYRNTVRAELNAEYPGSLRGIATGDSGRQEDIMSSSAMSMYDSPIEANANLWGEAFELALKVATNEIFDVKPKELPADAPKVYSELRVDIRREDPTDLSRKAAEGDKRYQMGIIPLRTLYMEYMGKTKEEADRMWADNFIDMALRNSPEFAQMIIQTSAEELSAEDALTRMRQMMEQGQSGVNPTVNYGSRGGPQRLGNYQSQEGMEMADVATRHEPRQSPRG